MTDKISEKIKEVEKEIKNKEDIFYKTPLQRKADKKRNPWYYKRRDELQILRAKLQTLKECQEEISKFKEDVLKLIDDEMKKTDILLEKTGMLKIKQKIKELGGEDET